MQRVLYRRTTRFPHSFILRVSLIAAALASVVRAFIPESSHYCATQPTGASSCIASATMQATTASTSPSTNDFLTDESSKWASRASCIQLNDGRLMPLFGLGVYQSNPGDETYNAVLAALRYGYRHIDTAEIYRNENDVGRALQTFMKESNTPREAIWVTTKLWPQRRNRAATITACHDSLKRLGLDYVDLYLIHSPMERRLRGEQWLAFEELRAQGKARSIGVSNYGKHHIDEVLALPGARVPPAVNQIEISPFLPRGELTAYCQGKGIVVEAYSPLTKAAKLQDPRLVAVAHKHGVTPAQVLIQWCLQRDLVTIPKSVHPGRIAENADTVTNFKERGVKLSAEDLAAMDGWDEGLVTGWDPTRDP